MTGECEVSDCDNRATGWVEAQWSVVDFVRYEVCDTCRALVFRVLQRRTVDGEFPVDVTSGWYLE